MTGNEQLFEIYLKKKLKKNVLVFIDLFYRYCYIAISSTQITCDVMCVQYVIQ